MDINCGELVKCSVMEPGTLVMVTRLRPSEPAVATGLCMSALFIKLMAKQTISTTA